MIKLTDHDKRVLSNIGHNAYGKEFVEIIEKLKAQVSSLEGLNAGGDHNAEVEGRLLFRDFANELIKHLSYEKHTPRVPDGAQIGDGRYD